MLRGVWQALNCLSSHVTYCVIVAGASPGETKMWAAVRENGDFCRAMLCIARLLPACGVRLSVRLSRSSVAPKRLKISSKFFRHRVAKPF